MICRLTISKDLCPQKARIHNAAFRSYFLGRMDAEEAQKQIFANFKHTTSAE